MTAILRRIRRGVCGPCLLLAIFTVALWLSTRSPLGGHYIAVDQIQSQETKDSFSKVPPLQARPTGVMHHCDSKNMVADGEIHFNMSHRYTEHELEVKFPEVKVGGHWSPPSCKHNQEVAIIIPFRDPNRDRHKNLMVLIRQLHILLQHQQLRYHVYVVHQNGTVGWFNKGMLMNLGFQHATNRTQSTCIVFHDVDVVPIDDRNSYTCGAVPRHLAANINNATGESYQRATGGALCLSSVNFTTINGFSNQYWGWGNEDNDLYRRFMHHKLRMIHSNHSTGRYLHLPHRRSYKSTGYKPPTSQSHLRDGLNSLDPKHKLLQEVPHKLFTWFNYHIQQPVLLVNNNNKKIQ